MQIQNLLLSIFAVIMSFSVHSQTLEVKLSSSELCEGELLRTTVRNCNGTLLWQDGKTGISRLDTAKIGLKLQAQCLGGGGQLLSKTTWLEPKVFPKPVTPFLYCSKDEIKLGRSTTIEVLGCDYEVNWSTGDVDSRIVVRPQETKTYTARCVSPNGCFGDPISRTIRVLKGDKAPEDPEITWKPACDGESILLKASGCTDGTYVWYRNEALPRKLGFTNKEIGRGNEIEVKDGGDDIHYTARCLFNECLGNESNWIYLDVVKKLPVPEVPKVIYLDEGESIKPLDFLPDPVVTSNKLVVLFEKERSVALNESISEYGSYYTQEVSKDGNCSSGMAKTIIRPHDERSRFYEAEEQLKAATPRPQQGTIQTFTNPVVLQATDVGAKIMGEVANDEMNGISIPQGFSPNGDGVNDLFVIETTHDEQLNLRVYNRLGHLVYESEDYKNDWNGKSSFNRGKNDLVGLPDDTYYYVLRLKDGRQKISFLTLKR